MMEDNQEMLLEFSVENFLSFKDRTTFSMIGSKDKNKPENLIKLDDINLLKSAVVYGANASGKTNLTLALNLVNDLVINSHRNQIGEEIRGLVPFKLDESYLNKKSSFEIVFVKNDTKYIYGFSIDKNKVYHEYLFYYPEKRLAKIFERNNTTEYDFKKDKREQNLLCKRTLENCLYLSTSANWNFQRTRTAFEWFVERFRGNSYYNGKHYTANLFNENEALVKPIKEFILRADVGILDVNIIIKDVSEGQIPKEFPYEIRKILLEQGGKTTEISTVHLGKDMEGNEKKIKFDLEEESEGTKKMFYLAGPFADVLENGRLLILDEMDTKLHPLLIEYLINLFHDPNKNKKGSQIILTTHDTHLLRENIFRRDQIWFTSKRQDQSTDVYSLYEYKARNNEDIEKRYLSGRYGAIPLIF